METKRCSKCGEVKAVDAFHHQASSCDGYRARCKPCHGADAAEWRKRNREKCNEASYRWAKVNPEKRAAIRKVQRARFAQAHPALVEARRRDYLTKNADAIKLQRKQFREKHAESIRKYKVARREVENAQERAHNHALTLGYIKKLIARSIKVTTATATPEIIEAKRAHLQMVRILKKEKQKCQTK